MIERYSRAEMFSIWTEQSKLQNWLVVELAVCKAWHSHGEIPDSAIKTIEKKANFDEKRIAEIEADVHHDVIAFLTSVAEFVGPDSRFIHMGMTSSDLLDTSFALQLKKSGDIILKDLNELCDSIEKRALEHKHTPMMGRSHGIHAEPITFGLKLAVFYAEFRRHIERFKRAIDDISVGKISGAVGTFAHITPEIEEQVCASLGLRAASISTQIIQRDRHANYFTTLALIAATVEKMATEIRHLQRTEVFEAAEPFGKGQKGSSAMPHKRNPVLCENISGLARLVRTNALAAMENVALWHERDISHSSVERVIAPDSTILVDFILARLNGVVSGLEVFPENMMKNIESSYGLFASQDIMLALIEKGITREEAYKLVQTSAMQSWKEKKNFKEIVLKDSNISSKLSSKEIDEIFDIKRHTKYVDTIFNRVFKK